MSRGRARAVGRGSVKAANVATVGHGLRKRWMGRKSSLELARRRPRWTKAGRRVIPIVPTSRVVDATKLYGEPPGEDADFAAWSREGVPDLCDALSAAIERKREKDKAKDIRSCRSLPNRDIQKIARQLRPGRRHDY